VLFYAQQLNNDVVNAKAYSTIRYSSQGHEIHGVVVRKKV